MANLIPGVALRETNLGIRVEKLLATEFSANIFTTYGRNLIKLLFGQITNVSDAGATTIKLQTETNTIDLCAATTIDVDAVGTLYFLTGEVAVILNGTGNDPIIDVGANFTGMPSSPIIFGRKATADAIQLVQTGDDGTGVIRWVVFYVPLDDGSYIEAA
jgi:hypothetical protein